MTLIVGIEPTTTELKAPRSTTELDEPPKSESISKGQIVYKGKIDKKDMGFLNPKLLFPWFYSYHAGNFSNP